MPNLTIKADEIKWLRTQIQQEYEKAAGPIPKLTGTIAIYEQIELLVQHQIEQPGRLLTYYNQLDDSSFKLSLKKSNIETGKADLLAKRYANAISANSLRKLIFDTFKQRAISVAFNEDFVHACYIFLLQDRKQILAGLNQQPVKPVSSLVNQTINPFAVDSNQPGVDTVDTFNKASHFRLEPLLPNNEPDPKRQLLDFAGTQIMLNRDNLDPNNNTITSRVQASLTWQDGEWHLENQSELGTTFFQVLRPIALQDGDVIMVGNRKYRFYNQ
jgi:hypothetical protein